MKLHSQRTPYALQPPIAIPPEGTSAANGAWLEAVTGPWSHQKNTFKLFALICFCCFRSFAHFLSGDLPHCDGKLCAFLFFFVLELSKLSKNSVIFLLNFDQQFALFGNR